MNGVDLNSKDINGNSAFDIVQKNGDNKIVSFLDYNLRNKRDPWDEENLSVYKPCFSVGNVAF